MQTHNEADATRIVHAVEALAPQIGDAAETIESERRLPPTVVRALQEIGVFRMAVPRAYGGPEFDPLTQVRVVEELSRLDGSVGWCAMIGAAASYASAFLDPPVAQRLFGNVDATLAGQIVPAGRAELVDDGYRVSGRYRFASGCQHATVMMAGCMIFEHGEPRRLADGQPETRAMLLPPSACTIVDTWQTSGLRGTGSHDFLVENAFVPFAETVSFFDPPRCAGPLYSFPPLFLVPHAGVPLGIARGALDAVVELSTHKEIPLTRRLLREDGQVQETIAETEAALGAARSYAYSALEELWGTLCRGETPSPRQRAVYRLMLVYVHRVAKEVISAMYDTAATSAIFRTHPLDRQMRDILAACQHRVVHGKMYRPAGRLLLGFDPGDPFF